MILTAAATRHTTSLLVGRLFAVLGRGWKIVEPPARYVNFSYAPVDHEVKVIESQRSREFALAA